jgi:hypothetical protein
VGTLLEKRDELRIPDRLPLLRLVFCVCSFAATLDTPQIERNVANKRAATIKTDPGNLALGG